MSIVLNEDEWAKQMIDESILGKKPFETLRRVARYYIDRGYSKKDVRRLLDEFVLRCDPGASLPKWSGMLDVALSCAVKYSPAKIDAIVITDSEMNTINKLSGIQTRRLAFTLLCLVKYWRSVNPNCDGWITNKDNEIMRLANINTSVRRQGLMYYSLSEAGIVQFSKRVDGTSIRVMFESPGDPVIKVSDFRNIGYQYMMYCGGPFFECSNCGITTKYSDPDRGRKQKYCRECAVKIKTKQSVDAVMRRRKQSQDQLNKIC